MLVRCHDMAQNNDVKIILGGTNAKIRQEREYYTITGKHGLHKTSNENGKLLTDFAQRKNMVIISTKFPWKDTHKATCVSPDGQTTIHIYHILIDRRQATSITNVRTYRGANYDSDHYLVKGMYKLRIQTMKHITKRMTENQSGTATKGHRQGWI